MLASIVLPLQVNRKQVEDQVQSFLNIVNTTDRQAYWDQELFQTLDKNLHFKVMERKWLDVDKAVVYLK